MSQSALKIFLTLAAVLIAGGAVVGVMAARFTHRLYLERAELRLNPGHPSHYARDNQALGAPVRPRVVLFGDSRVEWWQPAPAVAGHELVWRGIAGQTTGQMAIRFEQDVMALTPSTIVIQAGINDLVAGMALGRSDYAMEQLLGNLRSFVERARAAEIGVCLLTIVPPRAPSSLRRWLWSGDVSPQVALANRHILGWEGPGVTVVDAAAAMAAHPDSKSGALMHDAVHFSASGYELLNTLLAPCFRTGTDAVQ